MKFPAPLFLFLLLSLAGIATPRALLGYDAPNFDLEVFSADGVFLSDSDKESVLEALAAIASNFPNSKVDEDLKEKALGIALRIDPLHFNARTAHDALRQGYTPKPTNYFDSLSAISEALWGVSTRLLDGPAEPEEAVLATYLMEISLLTHPAPPDDRLYQFAALTESNANRWGRFLQLQPDDNASSRRAQMIDREREDILSRFTPETSMATTQVTTPPRSPGGKGPGMKKRPSASRPKSNDRASFEPITVSLPAVLFAKTVGGSTVGGPLSLHIRKPQSGPERELFPFIEAEASPPYPRFPLFSGRSGIRVVNLETTSAQAEQRGWEWPGVVVGEVHFDTEDSLPGPRRLCTANGRLASRILLECALSDKEINPDFAIAGELGSLGLTVELEGEPIDAVRSGSGLDVPYLLFPEPSLESLVAQVETDEDVQLLFGTEIISFTNLEEALFAFSEPTDEALKRASGIFSEIREASTRMALQEFVRNDKVIERLHEVVAAYPRHLSAKAILSYGQKPISRTVTIRMDVEKISSLIQPLIDIADPESDLNEARNSFDDIELALSRMRSEISPEARDYFDAAEDLVEASELFLNLTNRETAIAQQRERELHERITALEEEGARLGVSKP